jgi:hypothetical protein
MLGTSRVTRIADYFGAARPAPGTVLIKFFFTTESQSHGETQLLGKTFRFWLLQGQGFLRVSVTPW